MTSTPDLVHAHPVLVQDAADDLREGLLVVDHGHAEGLRAGPAISSGLPTLARHVTVKVVPVGPLAGSAFDSARDLALVHLDDAVRHGQAEAGAHADLLGGEERV